MFIEVRPLGEDAGLLQNLRHRPNEFLRLGIVFLNHNAGETMFPLAKIPAHVDEPFTTVGVVKQRWIETNGIQNYRFTPRSGDFFRRREKNSNVIERLANAGAADVCINQPELPVRMAQRRCPHAARISDPTQIELRLPCERMTD